MSPPDYVWPPPHLSVSSVQLFESCPAAYYAAYRNGRKGEPSAPMLFGSAFGKSLQTLHDDNDPRDHKIVFLEEYGAASQALSLRGASMFIPSELGMDLLDLYTADRYYGVPEQEFKLYLPESSGVPVPIKGFIDLATDHEVVEFKTSRGVWDQDRIEAAYQAHVYAWAYEQLFGKKPICVRYIIFSTKSPEIKELAMLPTQEGFQKFQDSAAAVWRAVETDTFPKLCRKCVGCKA